jgi:hypothetical protein
VEAWMLSMVLWKGGPIKSAGPFATQQVCRSIGDDWLARRRAWAKRVKFPPPPGYVCMITDEKPGLLSE